MKKFVCLWLIVVFMAVICSADEYRLLQQEDLQWGDPNVAVASGSVTGHPIDNTFKLSAPWVDVRAGYGTLVSGSGATEAQRTANTATIQAAINAARSANAATIVLIPSMYTYYINSTINLKDGVVLKGTSKWYGGLATDNNITMISMNGLAYGGVECLKLTGPAKGTGTGISITAGSPQTVVRDTYAVNFLDGLSINQDSSYIENFTADNCTTGINVRTTGNATYILFPHITNSDVAIRTGADGQSRGVYVVGGVIQTNTLGITGNANTKLLNVSKVYFEGNTSQDIQVGAGEGLTVEGCTFVISGVTESIYSNASFTTIRENHWNAAPTNSCISIESGTVEAQLIDNKFNSSIAVAKKYGDSGTRTLIVERGVYRPGISTFTDNAATPSVAGGTLFKTANTGATTITDFTDGALGQTIKIVFTDNVTTVQNNANIFLSGATNFVATPNDFLVLDFISGIGWVEEHRSVN
jgi:hypothetical protein